VVPWGGPRNIPPICFKPKYHGTVEFFVNDLVTPFTGLIHFEDLCAGFAYQHRVEGPCPIGQDLQAYLDIWLAMFSCMFVKSAEAWGAIGDPAKPTSPSLVMVPSQQLVVLPPPNVTDVVAGTNERGYVRARGGKDFYYNPNTANNVTAGLNVRQVLRVRAHIIFW
jgi:hypothetical protein